MSNTIAALRPSFIAAFYYFNSYKLSYGDTPNSWEILLSEYRAKNESPNLLGFMKWLIDEAGESAYCKFNDC